MAQAPVPAPGTCLSAMATPSRFSFAVQGESESDLHSSKLEANSHTPPCAPKSKQEVPIVLGRVCRLLIIALLFSHGAPDCQCPALNQGCSGDSQEGAGLGRHGYGMRGPMGASEEVADRLVRERVRCGESKGRFEGGHPNTTQTSRHIQDYDPGTEPIRYVPAATLAEPCFE